MTEWRIHRQLDKAGRRLRHVRLVTGLAVIWLLAALGAALSSWWVGRGSIHAEFAAAILAVLTLTTALLWTWSSYRSARDPRLLARRIEQVYPDLQSCLLTAVDQEPALPGGRYGFLQDGVIRQSLEHAYGHPWERSVPAWRLWAGHAFHGLALIPLVVSVAALATSRGPRDSAGANRIGAWKRPASISKCRSNRATRRSNAEAACWSWRGSRTPCRLMLLWCASPLPVYSIALR